MLNRRVIATLIVRDGIVVQSIGFRRYLPVGKPGIAIEFLNSWGVDEIVLLDISASKDLNRKNYAFVEEISRRCFVPLAVGGGISSIEDIRQLLQLGADKVVINTHCLSNPQFITQAAHMFGNQCIVVSIDVQGSSLSNYAVYNSALGTKMAVDPVQWALKAEQMGAGEIYLTSIERDGSKSGYDLALIEMVASAVKIPVIASGGAGHPAHMFDVFRETKASAVSAANFFHFYEHSVITTKAMLKQELNNIRLNTHAQYAEQAFEQGRLQKHDDGYLQHLLFEKIEKEVI